MLKKKTPSPIDLEDAVVEENDQNGVGNDGDRADGEEEVEEGGLRVDLRERANETPGRAKRGSLG